MFDEFLDDPQVYRAAQKYWEQLIEEVAAPLGQAGEWQPWLRRHYPDGRPYELEETPIVDGRSDRLNRGFSILQYPSEGGNDTVVAWINKYDPTYLAFPSAVLTLNLSLTTTTSEVARKLLEKWMSPATTVNVMEDFIDAVCPETAAE